MSIKAQKIKRIREELKMSANSFGIKCGYTGTTMLRIERGVTPASEIMCNKICLIYGVDPDWLNDDDRAVDEKEIYITAGRKETWEEQGKRLRIVIEESGLSQRQFINRLGGASCGISSLLSGKRAITPRYAEKIENEFGVGADWLLHGVVEAKEKPCSLTMITWLKLHPEWREKIWEEMLKENDKTE